MRDRPRSPESESVIARIVAGARPAPDDTAPSSAIVEIVAALTPALGASDRSEARRLVAAVLGARSEIASAEIESDGGVVPLTDDARARGDALEHRLPGGTGALRLWPARDCAGAAELARAVLPFIARALARSDRGPREGIGAVEALADRARLSLRQREVLDRMAQGRSNKEIASDLGCAEVTVEMHLTRIYRRVGVRGRQDLLCLLWGEEAPAIQKPR